MSGPETLQPLAGFTVGVTAARRAEELIALLEKRGATVVHAPTIRLVPLPDDTELLAATRACLEMPPDVVVVTTGMGFRGWVEAARGWGLADALLGVLGQARLMTRGPKAKGAVRAAGLREAWSPASESSSEVVAHLLGLGVTGTRVALQLHGEPLLDVVVGLRAAGAEVIEVPVYRWEIPQDTAPIRRMLHTLVNGGMDALTFTSASAVEALLAVAADEGIAAQVAAMLRGPVVAFAVGPATAGPLQRRGIPVRVAERHRLAGLVRQIVEVLPSAPCP
jgi:uroporphyrinogen-III synthase